MADRRRGDRGGRGGVLVCGCEALLNAAGRGARILDDFLFFWTHVLFYYWTNCCIATGSRVSFNFVL